MKNLVSLKLNGDVTLSEFAKVMGHFTSLLDELSSDVAESAEIEWTIAKLEGGSACAEVIGSSHNEFAVNKVVDAYEIIGKAITEKNPIPYSDKIDHEVHSIMRVINGKITSLEMGTRDFNTIIDYSIDMSELDSEKKYSFGTVTGWVKTLSKRGRMRFVLYDAIFDRAVNCYLAKNQENLMLNAWDKRISVAGKVYRDHYSGRPYEIRDVNYIEEKDSAPPGSFLDVEGIIPWQEGDEYPEEVIRRFRDAL